MQEIQGSDISVEFQEKVRNDLAEYTIGIIGVEEDFTAPFDLHGSGTLIQIEQTYGILTADHVLTGDFTERGLKEYPKMGVAYRPDWHSYSIPLDELKLIRIARGQPASAGPDLAVVLLPREYAQEIRRVKRFYDLSESRGRVLSTPPQRYKEYNNNWDSIWFLSGFPDVLTNKNVPNRREYTSISGMTVAYKTYEHKGFDFVEISALYNVDGHDSPAQFGGTSGGGLWYVYPVIDDQSGLQPKEKILVGVVFYQEAIIEGKRVLRCHGWHSIYEDAYEVIIQHR